MNDQDVAMNESSRQNIYAGLVKCYQLPGQELSDAITEMEHHLRAIESQAAPYASLLGKSFSANKNMKELQVEFARLFVGPYSLLAPPYGSIYLENERRIMGESTIDVLHYYNEAGLDIASTHKDAPDHIAAELEFMYYLINKEIIALAKEKDQLFLETLKIQKMFLNSHLNQWVQPFSQSIKCNTQTDFYINLADVTHIFVTEDADYLLNLEIYVA